MAAAVRARQPVHEVCVGHMAGHGPDLETAVPHL